VALRRREAGRIALYIIHFSGRGSILSLLKRDFQVKVISVAYIYNAASPPPTCLRGRSVFFFCKFGDSFRATERNPVGQERIWIYLEIL